jgi:hypothetical protein
LLRSPAEDFGRREWYYGLLQILPYLQPGAQVLETERQGGADLGLLAVRTADKHLALFFVNQQSAPIDLDLDLVGSPEMIAPASLSVIQTTGAAPLQPAGAIRLDQATASVTLPARSIVTLLGA